MPKIVQHRRDTTSGLANTLGAEAEFFYDTNKKTITVMDGTTTGGVTLAREDGQNATGNWPVNITGMANSSVTALSATSSVTASSATTAAQLVTANWVIRQSGNSIIFSFGTTSVARLDSTGNLVCIGNVTAFGAV